MNMNSRTLLLLIIAIIIAAIMVVMVKSRTGTTASSGPKVLVALENIPAGGFIRSDKNIGWLEWPQGSISPAFITEQAHKIEEFNGGVARRDITAGEPLSISSIVKANEGGFMSAVLAPGKRAVSIAVNSTSGNAGFVFPGDHVDLILTHRIPGDVLASETFIEDVRVLAVDQMLNNPDNKAVVAKTLTLEVTPKQAEMINVATSIGAISVSLRSLSAEKNNAASTPTAPAATTPSAPATAPGTTPTPAAANDNTAPAAPTPAPVTNADANAAPAKPAEAEEEPAKHTPRRTTSVDEGNYSTNSDVSKLMNDKGVMSNKVNVYHGSTQEQLNFQEGRK